MKKANIKSNRKELTRIRLIKAVGKVLAKNGFKGLGINKVAREAGVDKVLIYRYFGGLPGLVGAYSKTVDFWPTVDELMGASRNQLMKLPPDMQVAEFFKSFLSALRRRPLTQEILAWELLERNELTEQLEAVRVRTILEYFELLESIPDDDVLSSVVVLMGGAVNHLLIKSRLYSTIGGIDLSVEEGWDRIGNGIDVLLNGIFKS